MNKQIIEEAAEWFVEFSTGDADRTTRQEFDDWLRSSPAHLEAYLSLVPIWEDGARVQTPEDLTAKGLIGWARAGGNIRPLQAPMQAGAAAGRLPRRWTLGRLGASVAALCAAVAVLGFWYINGWPTYATQIGEQRSLELADGSIVELNARSRVRVRFSDHVRAVDLLEGQALFRVAKDPLRPFVVRSDATRVRAVGTEFDVDRRRSGTTVTVLEGRVAVWAARHAQDDAMAGAAAGPGPEATTRILAAAPGEVLLAVGQQVTIGAQGYARPTHADVGAVTAWRQRQLVFDKASLRDVADEFNRYNARRLTIDPELQDLVVSGVFSSTDPASLVRFLRAQLGMEVVESQREIRVIAKESPPR